MPQESEMKTNELHLPHRQNGESATGPKAKTCLIRFFRSNLFVVLMLLGVFLGVAIGAGLNTMDPKLNNKQIVYLRFPGDLFIQLMKMLIIPIVASSLVTSTSEMDIRSSGKIGLRAMIYYLSTLILAATLGMILAVTVRPGERIGVRIEMGEETYGVSSSPINAFMDLVRNMVPDNLLEVCFSYKRTEEERTEAVRKVEGGILSANISNVSLMDTFGNLSETTNTVQDVHAEDVSLVIKKVPGTNMIGLVVSSILFGCVISVVGTEARPLLEFFSALQAVSFKLISIFIWTSPVGIAFLIAAKLAQIDDMAKKFQNLAVFCVTVVGGQIVHVLVVLSVIYFVLVRKNPFKFLRGIIPAVVFAFSSASSAATLPLTIQCLQEKNGVDSRVAKLVASLGATINMDGACIYFTILPVFVAQMNGISLSAGDYLTICFLAISIAIGGAAVPGVGVVYILMMLTAMDLPMDEVSTLVAIDWFLDRSRTCVNVIGDGFGAGITEHLSRRELQQPDSHSEDNKTSKSVSSEIGDELEGLMTTKDV